MNLVKNWEIEPGNILDMLVHNHLYCRQWVQLQVALVTLASFQSPKWLNGK